MTLYNYIINDDLNDLKSRAWWTVEDIENKAKRYPFLDFWVLLNEEA